MGITEWGVVISIAVVCGGGIVWGIRLEGRVNQQDRLADEREKNHEAMLGERARMEELRYEVLRSDINLLRQQQTILDSKIDRLLERP